MKRAYLNLAWTCGALVLLSACESGPSQAGIEGSGITTSPVAVAITTSGEVTALGSIVVNDVAYDLVGATITIDGLPARDSDLAPGQVAVVEGGLTGNGTRGDARRVIVETAVAGRISAIDVAFGQFTILRQTIAIDAGTIVANGVDGGPLRGLDVGADVQVSGFADSTGTIHATRVDSRKASTPLLLTGRVSNLDASSRTFAVNGQIVSYATAILHGFTAPAEGMTVRVAGQSLDRDALVADEVSRRAEGLPGNSGTAAALHGWVTRFSSAHDFDVDGRRVVIDSSQPTDVVRLDSFVFVRGELIADGVVAAIEVKAVLPGRIAGGVTIDGSGFGISGLVTMEGGFRLNIESLSGGAHVHDSGVGLLVGDFTFSGRSATGTGVLIGEGCAQPTAGRFCGRETAVLIEVTKTGSWIDQGSSGVIRVATEDGAEIWPLRLAYHGGQAGLSGGMLDYVAGVYELHQAEFVQENPVHMTVYGDGRLFFQSSDTGCIGNGTIARGLDQDAHLYHVALEIEGCRSSFSHLNADFEGLSTLESLTPWDYDFSTLSMWLSTPAGATSPAALTLWAMFVG